MADQVVVWSPEALEDVEAIADYMRAIRFFMRLQLSRKRLRQLQV